MRNIKCYCCGDRNKNKNDVFVKDSEDYKKWLDTYTKDLENYVNRTDVLSVKKHYQDPDGSYYFKNKEFFTDLTDFLNKQENDHIKEENRYTYRFEKEDYKRGICVRKNNETLFYLRSDQFGFSAPTPDDREYPYDLYSKSDDKDKCKKIATWISNTRTIGGSFLWPLKLNKTSFHREYNQARGGKNTSKNNYFMQDRVDLTLYEVSCFYDKDNKQKKFKTKLSTYIEKYKYAKEWFEHFENFSTYVKFFCFEDFVIGNEVKDMTRNNNEKITEDSYLETRKKPFFKQPQDITTISNILDTLSQNVLNRSNAITDILLKK